MKETGNQGRDPVGINSDIAEIRQFSYENNRCLFPQPDRGISSSSRSLVFKIEYETGLNKGLYDARPI